MLFYNQSSTILSSTIPLVGFLECQLKDTKEDVFLDNDYIGLLVGVFCK